MLKRSTASLLRISAALRQGGWGSAASGAGGGGRSGGSGGGGGGGGWGSAGGGGAAPSSGGWGDSGQSRSPPSRERAGGWGTSSGGGDKKGWEDGDAGWRGAPTGQRQSGGGGGGWGGGGADGGSGGGAGGARGNFRKGRGQDRGGGGGGWGGGAGVWGEPRAVDEEAWRAAPPSFTPPVRRVDPLTLTAVEVEIDGVKKLVGQRVQITGLSDGTTWHTLKDHLRQVGEVSFCKIFSNGRAMVEFSTPEDSARAVTELQGSELEGATLFMREDREDIVLVNTRRKIREARDAQLRVRKEEAERLKREHAIAEGDRPAAGEEK